MNKLYKWIDNMLHYWQILDDENCSATIYWGKVGFRGEIKTVRFEESSNYKREIIKEIHKKQNEGYIQFEDMDLTFIEIIYPIEGIGTSEDLDKRHKLEEEINELLNRTGLGLVDGGSIGNGTMEVACYVVDSGIAKKEIQRYLKDSEFMNYKKIEAFDQSTESDKPLEELIETAPFKIVKLKDVKEDEIIKNVFGSQIISKN